MFEYVLFDLDGTLIDSESGIINSVLYAFEKYNITVNEKDELRKFIGPAIQESFSTDYGFNEEEVPEVIATFREYYSEKGVYEGKVFEGIVDVLKELKKRGKKLAVATSKPEVFTLRVLEHFGLAQYFDYVAAASLDETKTKKFVLIGEVVEHFDVDDLDKVVMVGDRKQDIRGAADSGVTSIAVKWGYGSDEEIAKHQPDYVAEKVEDLLELIK